ncbi:hypothetical protein DPMN_175854 [Dreissena polymorpha]|uniref:Uncharacterized protein n=1 Tax=Dreissena polymorpha TaxID=45954 RepID=A0A9D4IJ53_DREPO|nr:hypothetical protein DPMN_175854 [Dreissena polymorpha]
MKLVKRKKRNNGEHGHEQRERDPTTTPPPADCGMCAWNNHYCWPGICGDELAEKCVCAPGFTKRYKEDVGDINAGETSCQLDGKTLPDLLTCNTVAVGVNGEKKRALSPGTSTSCPFLQDMYGNFRPEKMEIEFTSEFTVTYASSRPPFIKEENFGISDALVKLKLKAISERIDKIVDDSPPEKGVVYEVAINNAIEASEPACSDGITRDLNPPQIRNVQDQVQTILQAARSLDMNRKLCLDSQNGLKEHRCLRQSQDSDYQLDVTVISANWKDFYDSESGLAFYRVGLGTVPYEDNERIMTHVELMTGTICQIIVVWEKGFYFVN